MKKPRKYSEVREAIKVAASKGRSIRAEINQLKWKTPEDPQRLVVLRKAKAPSFRAVRKAARRPETGPQRYALWNDKRVAGHEARYCLLALAYLLGRPYRSVEGHTESPPFAGGIQATIERFFGDTTVTKEAVLAWLTSEAMPVAASVAA